MVFLFLSMQYIRLTTYCHIFVKQLMTDFCLFQSHLLSQNGNNTVLLMLFVIMTGFFPPDNLIYLSGLKCVMAKSSNITIWNIVLLCILFSFHYLRKESLIWCLDYSFTQNNEPTNCAVFKPQYYDTINIYTQSAHSRKDSCFGKFCH
jgi:hypothetical protein